MFNQFSSKLRGLALWTEADEDPFQYKATESESHEFVSQERAGECSDPPVIRKPPGDTTSDVSSKLYT